MATRKFHPVTPRGRIDAGELARMGRRVEGQSRIVAGTGLDIGLGSAYSSAGPTFFREGATEFWAKLTGVSGSAYAWTEVAPSTSGAWATFDGGRTGTTSAFPAYETTLNSALATDGSVVVWLRLAATQDFFIFERPSVSSSVAFSGARVVRETNQTVSGSADIEWEGFDFDTDGYWDSLDPTKLTVPDDGKYEIGGCVIFNDFSTGARMVELTVNGLTPSARTIGPATATGAHSTAWCVVDLLSLDAGDYVTFTVLESAGGSVDVTSRGGWICKVG